MIILNSSGRRVMSMLRMMAFMHTDLPVPVRAGDEQVRHLGQVVNQRPAFGVLAKEQRDLALGDLLRRPRGSLP